MLMKIIEWLQEEVFLKCKGQNIPCTGLSLLVAEVDPRCSVVLFRTNLKIIHRAHSVFH